MSPAESARSASSRASAKRRSDKAIRASFNVIRPCETTTARSRSRNDQKLDEFVFRAETPTDADHLERCFLERSGEGGSRAGTPKRTPLASAPQRRRAQELRPRDGRCAPRHHARRKALITAPKSALGPCGLLQLA